MSRMSLLPLIALALVACSVEEEVSPVVPEPVQSASTEWSAPPGEAEMAEPMVIPAPIPESVEVVADASPLTVEDIVDGEGDKLLEIEVRPGESLALLARWSGLTAEQIAENNGVAVTATLYPGQLLEFPVSGETFDAMQTARDDFEDARLDRYLTRRGGLLGVTGHTVGTGETAWQVAKDHGELPLWVLSAFNRGENLDVLRIGQELSLPLLGDSVAMDDEPLEEVENAARDSDEEVVRADSGAATVTESTIP